MKRLRGVGIVCLALGVVILLSAIFATALGARVGALGAWMDEARAAQAAESPAGPAPMTMRSMFLSIIRPPREVDVSQPCLPAR